MGKRSSSYSAFGSQANRFSRAEDVLAAMTAHDPPELHLQCSWLGCPLPQWEGTPVCFTHALVIGQRLHQSAPEFGPEGPEPLAKFQSFVYYLMLSPQTVKIGTTQWLPDRMRQLRTELQYVVAVELGGRKLERERHVEFYDERRNKAREDFHLSDRLKRHIEDLQPKRDELIRLAVEHRRINA